MPSTTDSMGEEKGIPDDEDNLVLSNEQAIKRDILAEAFHQSIALDRMNFALRFNVLSELAMATTTLLTTTATGDFALRRGTEAYRSFAPTEPDGEADGIESHGFGRRLWWATRRGRQPRRRGWQLRGWRCKSTPDTSSRPTGASS
jgi:hypothetical protein